jgi:hypothetical protein
VHGLDCEVTRATQRVLLRRTGSTKDIFFDVRPRRVGTVVLRVTIQLARSLSLLDELAVELPVVERQVSRAST